MMKSFKSFRFLLAALPFVLVVLIQSCGSEKEVSTTTGYLNHAAGVKYLGTESCKSCHQEIYKTYVHTGMGRSLYKPDPGDKIETFGPEAVVYDTFSGYWYRPYWKGNDFYIEEFRLKGGDTIYQRAEKVDFIVGSGNQTRSYLMYRNQYLYEMPITWYVSRKGWDLSPGYEGGQNTRFSREIGEECMSCHTGHIDYVEGTVNQFEKISLGIDCEKCHGPGQIHVERMERDEIVDVGEEIDYSIVNPAKLTVRRQFEVCKQCHLQGINVLKGGKSVLDFRPGQSLSEVFDIFIEEHGNDADFGIASHAERLIESQCFIQSGDKLTCTTCHNPHESVHGGDPKLHNRSCQSCHTSGEIMCGLDPGLMAEAGNDCISCHMKKGATSDIPHVAFTDHKIRIYKEKEAVENKREGLLQLVCLTDSNPRPDVIGKAWLLYFERNASKPEYLEKAAQNLKPDDHFARAKVKFYQGEYDGALSEIEAALATAPKNTWMLFKKAEILEGLGRLAEAKALYREIYQLNPRIDAAGLKIGVLALRTAKVPQEALKEARTVFEELKKKKPFDEKILSNLGFVEMNSGNFEQAEKLFADALKLDPAYLLALENMIIVLVQKGQKEKARTWFEQLLLAHPDYAKKAVIEKMLS